MLSWLSCKVCAGLGLALAMVVLTERLMHHATYSTPHAAPAVHIASMGWSQISGRAAAASKSMQCVKSEAAGQGVLRRNAA